MHQRREGGYAAIAALIAASMIAALAILTIRLTSMDARIAVNDIRSIQVREALASGVDTAVARIALQEPGWPGTLVTERMIGPVNVTVEIVDEAAFVDLNKSDAGVLTALVRMTAGTPAGGVDQAMSRVEDPEGDWPLAERYLRQRTTPFQSVIELEGAPGVSDAALRALLRYVTVFSIDGRINPRSAPAAVLAALPAAGPDRAEEILRARSGRGGITMADAAAMLPAAVPLLREDVGPVFRIVVSAEYGEFRASLEATVWVAADAVRPYRVLSWRENW